MGALNTIKGSLAALILVLISSIILIILGLFYFVLTLWVVKMGADILDLNVSGDFAVLSAALITLGSLAGSALTKQK